MQRFWRLADAAVLLLLVLLPLMILLGAPERTTDRRTLLFWLLLILPLLLLPFLWRRAEPEECGDAPLATSIVRRRRPSNLPAS